jgi:hypothetical protein
MRDPRLSKLAEVGASLVTVDSELAKAAAGCKKFKAEGMIEMFTCACIKRVYMCHIYIYYVYTCIKHTFIAQCIHTICITHNCIRIYTPQIFITQTTRTHRPRYQGKQNPQPPMVARTQSGSRAEAAGAHRQRVAGWTPPGSAGWKC